MPDGKYLIGESLREKLKSTIAKVDSIPFGGPVSRIPTLHEGDFGSGNKRCLVMQMKIYSLSGSGTFPEGSVVQYDINGKEDASRTDDLELNAPLSPPYDGYLSMYTAKAYLHRPSSVQPLVSPAVVYPWGVTISGGTLNDSVVGVIVRGIAPVRIRSMTYRGGPPHYYAFPSVRRTSLEPVAQLSGVLETTDCACDNAAQIVYIGGSSSATSGGAETAQVFWGLVNI